jgi:integrase
MVRRINRLTQAMCEKAMPLEVVVPASQATVEAEMLKVLRSAKQQHLDRRSRIRRFAGLGGLGDRIEQAPPGYMVKYKTRWLIDGAGLALIVSSPNNWKARPGEEKRPIYRSWVFRWSPGDVVVSKTGKARKLHRVIGLGPLSTVPLARARELADCCRRDIQEGRDPLLMKRTKAAERKIAERRLHTLNMAIDEYMRTHSEARGTQRGWTPKHARDWKASFDHIKDLLDLPVSRIDRPAVISALQPIFHTEVGRRLRSRLYQVLEMATAKGWRDGANPAAWSLLKHSLPNNHKAAQPHAALKYKDAPEFMRRIQAVKGVRGRAVELVLLTGVRVGEVLAMKPEHLNLDEAIWEVPAELTKTGKRSGQSHVVPLSTAAIECLKQVEMKPGELMFDIPVHEPNRLTQKLWPEYPIRCHGFRSTLRTWVADETDYAWEVGEAVLHHAVGSDVARRYLRTSWLDQRRALLQDYADYLRRGK